MKTPIVVLGLALLLTACQEAAVPASATATPTAASTSAAESASVRATPSVSATVAPSPTLSPAPTSTSTPEPAAFGSAVFADPDDCTNPNVGYRVAYPDTWFSNAAMADPLDPDGPGIEPCWLFAPTNFEVEYGTEIPADVAIVIRRHDEWDSGSFSGRHVLTEEQTLVDGLPARVQEIEITEHSLAAAPGDRLTEYVVELEDGSFLVAATYLGPDYDMAKSVLSDMMETMQIGAP